MKDFKRCVTVCVTLKIVLFLRPVLGPLPPCFFVNKPKQTQTRKKMVETSKLFDTEAKDDSAKNNEDLFGSPLNQWEDDNFLVRDDLGETKPRMTRSRQKKLTKLLQKDSKKNSKTAAAAPTTPKRNKKTAQHQHHLLRRQRKHL